MNRDNSLNVIDSLLLTFKELSLLQIVPIVNSSYLKLNSSYLELNSSYLELNFLILKIVPIVSIVLKKTLIALRYRI